MYKIPNPKGNSIPEIFNISEDEYLQIVENDQYSDTVFAITLLTYLHRNFNNGIVLNMILESLTGQQYDEIEDLVEYLVLHINTKEQRKIVQKAIIRT